MAQRNISRRTVLAGMPAAAAVAAALPMSAEAGEFRSESDRNSVQFIDEQLDRAKAEYAQAMAEDRRLTDAFQAALPPDLLPLFLAQDASGVHALVVGSETIFLDIARHFPGFASALLAVREHCEEMFTADRGKCCS